MVNQRKPRVINLTNVPEELHRRLKMQAAAESTTLRELILRVLSEYLDQKGGGR